MRRKGNCNRSSAGQREVQKALWPVEELSSELRMGLSPSPVGHTISKVQPSGSMAGWLLKGNAFGIEKGASDVPTETLPNEECQCMLH